MNWYEQQTKNTQFLGSKLYRSLGIKSIEFYPESIEYFCGILRVGYIYIVPKSFWMDWADGFCHFNISQKQNEIASDLISLWKSWQSN